MKNLKNSKLIRILHTFSNEEFKEYEKLVESPYFNKGRNYIHYLKVLKKFHPDYENEKLTKEFLYSKANKDKTYNEQVFKTEISGLVSLANEYLAQLTMKKNEHIKLILLSIEERGRLLLANAENTLDKANEKIEELGVSQFFFLLKNMSEVSSQALKVSMEKQSLVNENILRSGIYNIYFLLSSLSITLFNMQANQINFNTGYKDTFPVFFGDIIDLKKLEKYLISNDVEFREVILFYVYLLMLIKHDTDIEYYEKMKNLFFKNYSSYSRAEQYLLTNLLAELTQGVFGFGTPIKSEEAFLDLADFALKNGLYKFDEYGNFPSRRFRSYFFNALALDKTDWVRELIDKHSHELAPQVRDDVIAIFQSYLELRGKNYDNASTELNKVKFTLFEFKFDVKLLNLQILYERDCLEEADYAADAFYKFINENITVSESKKGRFGKFIHYYKLLLKLRDNNVIDAEEIIEEMKKDKSFRSWKWLKEKFEELEK